MVEQTTSDDRDVAGHAAATAGDGASASPGSPDRSADTKVTTEGSARVLNEVKGRLERIETGALPVIERIGPDGTVRRVDQTGEMIRPEPGEMDAARRAAEAFADEHSSMASHGDGAMARSAPVASADEPVAPRAGFWARIAAWFRRG